MKAELTLKEKKKIYVRYVETLVMNGYDISDMLNPIYSKYNYEVIEKEIERLTELHQ